jgi:ABC-type glycerol-3-phosphate transport system substrate-binding protein
MSNFQTILVAIFLAFFVFAVLIFSGVIKIDGLTGKDNLPKGKVVVWGTFPSSSLSKVFDDISKDNKELNVSYKRKDTSFYQEDLIEAFANGEGPDLFIITADMIQKNENFLYKIPYTSYPEKTFRESYIDGADIYLDTEGVLGFPLVVDPLVLYYNKDILSNEGIVSPPKTWDELFILNSSLTKKENSGAISESMIAMGQYGNVNNVKDILSMLLAQNDNPIIKRGEKTGYVSTLDDSTSSTFVSPVEAVLKFFLEFSNSSSAVYSWNRSLPNSLDMFVGGELAFYLGKASELFTIESMNPNLSFDVTQVPQIKDTKAKRTIGDIYLTAINKRSTNLTSAFGVATMLSQGEVAKAFGAAVSLPPTSRALLSEKPTDNYLFTFFNSALISRTWLDPDKAKSDMIFRELIENLLSNQLSMDIAINKAEGQLELLNKK